MNTSQVDAFLHILKEGTGPEVEEHFVEAKFERLQMHCALASFYLNKAATMKDRTAKNNALTQATSHLNKGLGIDVNEQLPVLGLGQVALVKVKPLYMHNECWHIQRLNLLR